MSVSADYDDEMRASPLLDDTTMDLILAGRPVGDESLSAVAAFVAEIRASAPMAVPVPSAALAAVLARGVTALNHSEVVAPSASPPARRTRWGSSWARRRSRLMPRLLSGLAVPIGTVGFGAKAAFGLTLAAASVTAAGAAGVLPDPVQHAMASVVRAVSPFEIPDPADHRRDTGHHVDPDRGDDAGEGSPSTSDETAPPADEHQREPGRQPPDGSAPIDTSSPGLDDTGPAPADGWVPTTVPSGTAPAGQDPPADTPSGAPTDVPTEQPRNTPTTQPDRTPPPSGDISAGTPQEGPGGRPETPPTTEPTTTSTTPPATTPTGRR